MKRLSDYNQKEEEKMEKQMNQAAYERISEIITLEIDKIKRDPWKKQEVEGIYAFTSKNENNNPQVTFVEVHSKNVIPTTKYINIDSVYNEKYLQVPEGSIAVKSINITDYNIAKSTLTNEAELLQGKILYDRDGNLRLLKNLFSQNERILDMQQQLISTCQSEIPIQYNKKVKK